MADVLFQAALLCIWLLLSFHMFLAVGGYLLSRRYREPIQEWESKGRPLPTVSILIPAHNEEVVIARTLRWMARLEYPRDRLEVIVINDNSSDRTGEIAEEFAARHDFIKVVHLDAETAGRGKPGALNQGLRHATGEMIVVYDADNTPERKAVYYLALALQNTPGAGAVVGKFRVINARQSLLTRFINVETIMFQWLAQAGRYRWFGITTIPGTNFIIYRHLLEQLGGWERGALAEDTELSIRVYESGHTIRFFPAAVTWEQEPATWRVWWKQRLRWVRGNQQVMWKALRRLPAMIGRRIALDVFYLLGTYLLFFGAVTLSNGLFVTSLIVDLHLTGGAASAALWVMAFGLFMSQALMTLSLEKTQLNLGNALVALLMYFTYAQLWLLLVVSALWVEMRIAVLKQDVTWYKTERFRLSTNLRASRLSEQSSARIP